jgi:hypothetical protein
MMQYLHFLFNQPNVNSKNTIVISAGAAKGFYQLGALHYLYSELNIQSEINVFCGTSVGASIACLLACGYTPIDIFTYMCTDDINECWTYDFSLKRFLIDFGIIPIDKMKYYLENLIVKKMGFIPTFEELYYLTGHILVCPAWKIYTNNNDHKTYFNYINTPNISILDGVIASCALPFIFTKCKIESDYYIDGGMFDRLCIDYTIHFLESITHDINDKLEIDKIYVIDGVGDDTLDKKDKHSLLDYIKQILFIPFFIQEKNSIDKYKDKYNIKYFKLLCEHFEVTLSLPVKQRINNFCSGYSQMKLKLENET